MKNYKLIPKITLWVLLGLGIICTALFFFFGGTDGQLEVAGDFLDIPYHTNLFLYWNYMLVALVCLTTLAVIVTEFCKLWKSDMKKAIRSLCVCIGFAGVVILCWVLGSAEKVEILGYEGTDNEGTMARLSDACMYLTYILVVATTATLIWGWIHTKFINK